MALTFVWRYRRDSDLIIFKREMILLFQILFILIFSICLLAECIMLNPRGECRTKVLGWTEEMSRHQTPDRSETRGDYLFKFAKPTITRPFTTWYVNLWEIPGLGWLSPFILIPCIITFDCIFSNNIILFLIKN